MTGRHGGRRWQLAVAAGVAGLALVVAGVAWPRESAVSALTNCDVNETGYEQAEADLLSAMNAYRAQQVPPAPPLSADDDLNRAAQWLANDMAAHGSIYHVEPPPSNRDPLTRIRDCGETGIGWWSEIVLVGASSGSQALAKWQGSSGHDCAIRDPRVTRVGIGKSGPYWAVDFTGPTYSTWNCKPPAATPTPGGPPPANTAGPTKTPMATETPRPTATPTTAWYQSYAAGSARE